MFFKKKQSTNEIQTFIFSDNAILFIKKYALPEIKINKPIDEDTLDTIVSLAADWELDMIDPLSIDGCDKTYDYPEKERNEMADAFVTEITGKWNDDSLIPDFDDLNKRLGLI